MSQSKTIRPAYIQPSRTWALQSPASDELSWSDCLDPRAFNLRWWSPWQLTVQANIRAIWSVKYFTLKDITGRCLKSGLSQASTAVFTEDQKHPFCKIMSSKPNCGHSTVWLLVTDGQTHTVYRGVQKFELLHVRSGMQANALLIYPAVLGHS